jgi:hypothetical protein
MDAKLIRKLDLWWSRIVRYRAAGKGGFAQCYTCAVVDSVVQMDNGHFIDRAWLGHRFSENNCRIQCRKCNRLMSGNIDRYEVLLRKELGDAIIDDMIANKEAPLEISEKEAKSLITKWRAECRLLRNQKGF